MPLIVQDSDEAGLPTQDAATQRRLMYDEEMNHMCASRAAWMKAHVIAWPKPQFSYSRWTEFLTRPTLICHWSL